MRKEKWKAIDGYPCYEVSSRGRVRSLDRTIEHSNGMRQPVKGQILSPFIVKSTGYMQINLSKRARRFVHQLVARAFCEGWFQGAVVNHKNGVKDDNSAENLEWVTRSENGKHMYRELGVKPWSLGMFSQDHPTSKAVISTCMKTGDETFYGAAMDAVRSGFRSDSISRCCNKKIAHHKGFYWRFAKEKDGLYGNRGEL